MIARFFNWLKSLFAKKPVLKLVPDIPEADKPTWLKIAEKELGQKEYIPGDKPRIIEYHSTTWLDAKEDEIPWCASFVSWALEKAGIRSQRTPRAKDYLLFGSKLDIPKIGCIVVLTRSGGGHVGFYISSTATTVTLLGGNQSDAVTIASYSKANVIGYRWPK